jgi:hypothetical protein
MNAEMEVLLKRTGEDCMSVSESTVLYVGMYSRRYSTARMLVPEGTVPVAAMYCTVRWHVRYGRVPKTTTNLMTINKSTVHMQQLKKQNKQKNSQTQ